MSQLLETLREVRRREREACIRDVCMYCGGRAPGWEAAEGPNLAGNWTHEHGTSDQTVLCAASSIRARARFNGEEPTR
jgi:hypothetical protein